MIDDSVLGFSYAPREGAFNGEANNYIGASRTEKLALKRLAGSDLSFFDFHFRKKSSGDHRQKGINLNTDVFADQFYPQAHALLAHGGPF
jgi:hypothetical protein